MVNTCAFTRNVYFFLLFLLYMNKHFCIYMYMHLMVNKFATHMHNPFLTALCNFITNFPKLGLEESEQKYKREMAMWRVITVA